MKLLLPIFATLGLFAAACSGGETAIEVETETAETTTTTTTVAPTTTTTLVKDVEVPTTHTVAPTTTQATPAEPVGDAEQVVTSPTTNTRGRTEIEDTIVLEGEEELLQYQGYFAKAHSHDTADGEITHNHAYYTTAPSHFHREGIIIYLDLYENEFTNDDVGFGDPNAIYDCNSDGCSKATQPSSEIIETETRWLCPPYPLDENGRPIISSGSREERGCVEVN